MPATQESRTTSRSTASRSAYRVMVVDDSAVIRGLISRWIETDTAIQVVGSAADGNMALKNIARARPEIVILDIEMPGMDGITLLPKLLEIDPELKIIMASTLTRRGAEISLRALSAGAADYVPKPESTRDTNDAENFRRTLIEKVKALGAARRRKISGDENLAPAPARRKAVAPVSRPMTPRNVISLRKPSTERPRVVGIASSTGGPQALLKVLANFPRDFKLPVTIVQHMPPTFTAILAEHIAKAARIPCTEAVDGEELKSGHIYLAPGDFHLQVRSEKGAMRLRLNEDEPENFCRPAADQLLRSLARQFGSNTLAAVLTGMGQDGLLGARDIVAGGGTVLAQDEETSVVWGMPGAVAVDGICAAVLPLPEIGPKLVAMCGGRS